MIEQCVFDYLQEHILKKGEQLDVHHLQGTGVLDLPIVKRTERTYRVLGMLTLSINHSDLLADCMEEELEAYRFTPKKKVALDDQRIQVKKWIEQGWVMKEVRFKKDEKTVESIHYRMGYRLYQWEKRKTMNKLQAQERVWQDMKKKLEQLSLDLSVVSSYRKEAVLMLKQKAMQWIDNQGTTMDKWTWEKRLRFMHFIVAVLLISVQNRDFDWKEIGALYYQRIGGSKAFDRNKEEFMEQLEDMIGYPLSVLGLTSLGRITPLFFSGELKGRYATFQYGPVHSLTDLSIAEEQLQSSATTLWLVENRAVLTRMAAEKGFLEENESLILCNDGHLRSSHKEAIHQIIRNSSLQQVIIWTDYDQDGLQIARELYETIDDLSCKWISPHGDVMTKWRDFEQEMKGYLQSEQKEQEQILGGAEQWKSWVHH